MWAKYFDPKEDVTYELNLSILPYLPLPQDKIDLMINTLEFDSIGRVLDALHKSIYKDKEPELTTKAERGYYEVLLADIPRLSYKYFKSISKLKNQGGSVRILDSNDVDVEQKTIKKETNDSHFCPWTDNVENDNFNEPWKNSGMTEDDYKSQLSPQELAIINLNR